MIYKKDASVNTGIGYDAELHCSFSSDPEPTRVHWYKDGERLHDGDKYKIYNDFDKKGHSRTSLRVKNVTQNDLVHYACDVENYLGKAHSKISLSLAPSTIELVNHKYEKGALKTEWRVKSIQPLTEFHLSWKNATVSDLLLYTPDFATDFLLIFVVFSGTMGISNGFDYRK